MLNYLKIKMFLCKLLTFYLPKKQRKLLRDFLFYFSYTDYVRFHNSRSVFISLGNSCITRALLVSMGVKPRRIYGELSYPFDLCLSNDLKRIVDLIETDFKTFFKELDLNSFPHDKNLSIKAFIKRYTKRIKNFMDIYKCDKKIYYIYSNYETLPDKNELIRLYNVLKIKHNNQPFELILLLRQRLNIPHVKEFPYDILMDDSCAIEYMLNPYGIYNNKYTQYRDKMKEEFQKIIIN